MKRSEREIQKQAELLVEAVNNLPQYESRAFKMQNSANFKFAINKALAMHEWIWNDWIPRQPDKDNLKKLLSLLNYKMKDFCGFVYLGNKYWERIEQEKKVIDAPFGL